MTRVSWLPRSISEIASLLPGTSRLLRSRQWSSLSRGYLTRAFRDATRSGTSSARKRATHAGLGRRVSFRNGRGGVSRCVAPLRPIVSRHLFAECPTDFHVAFVFIRPPSAPLAPPTLTLRKHRPLGRRPQPNSDRTSRLRVGQLSPARRALRTSARLPGQLQASCARRGGFAEPGGSVLPPDAGKEPSVALIHSGRPQRRSVKSRHFMNPEGVRPVGFGVVWRYRSGMAGAVGVGRRQ